MLTTKCKTIILKPVFLAALLSAVAAWSPVHAQNMVIKSTDGTEQAIALDSIGLVTFTDNTLVVNFAKGYSNASSLSSIRKIYFTQVQVGVQEDKTQSADQIAVCPNPVKDILTLQNLPETVSVIEIYGLDGKLVKQALLASANTVDVTGLPSGSYIIKLNNQVINFIKL